MGKTVMLLPGTDERSELGTGAFSVSCLFLGPFWFVGKRMFGVAALSGVGVIVTGFWGWLVLPFLANRLHRKFLLRRGFSQAEKPLEPTRPQSAPRGDLQAHRQAVRAMIEEVAKIPVDTSTCMDCRAHEVLETRLFGFARILDVDYSATAASAGISAISLLLGGPGMIKGPKTTANIIRTELVLCRACLKRRTGLFGIETIKDVDYALHPWEAAAQRNGFTKHFDNYDLQRYKSTT
jgi:hypothetical protein